MSFYSIEQPNILHLYLHIQPKSSRTTIVGLYGDRLKIALQAPPVDGKANKELQQLFSKKFKLSKSTFFLKSGEFSKQKELIIFYDKPQEIIDEILNSFS